MLKRISGFIILSGFLLLLFGCPYGHRNEEGKFPEEITNFDDINSEFDDYNSTSPVIESNRYLYFSSNRNSNGGDYDIVGENMRIFWDKDKGVLTIDDHSNYYIDHSYSDSLFLMVNTASNEFGPYSLPFITYHQDEEPYFYFTDIVFFSNDVEGNLDLKFAWFGSWGERPKPDEGTYDGPQSISFLNSMANDAYLTFYGPGFMNYGYYGLDPELITELLFCSDRDGKYNIYSSPVPPDSTILDFISGDSQSIISPVAALNSDSDDKCPYVQGDILVFTSNRPGGYGGFDLYYSLREGDSWGPPINFGEKINTEFDEYRPIVMYEDGFINNLMLFSSNRPGGQGGFDLYYVGIPRMIY